MNNLSIFFNAGVGEFNHPRAIQVRGKPLSSLRFNRGPQPLSSLSSSWVLAPLGCVTSLSRPRRRQSRDEEEDEDGHERPPETCTKTRWFQIFFYFHPYLGKMNPF